jgi:uncharacterized protein (DUF885 family)
MPEPRATDTVSAAGGPTGAVHAACDRFVAEYAELDPIAASGLGIAGPADRLTDYSPKGDEARAALRARALRAVLAADPGDAHEAAAQSAFAERMGIELAIHEAGLYASMVNVIESPVQQLRQVFDLMPTVSDEDWSAFARRLAAVPQAMAGLRAGLRQAADRGRVSALRQLISTADHCDIWAEGLASLVRPARVPAALRADLDAGAIAAATAFTGMAGFLRGELAARAPARDAVGPDAYRLWLRYFTGSRLAPEDAYAWGWQEFQVVAGELRRAAGQVRPGFTPAEAAAALNEDPRQTVRGTEALLRWAQELSDEALRALHGAHFDIPGPLRTLEHLIAPPGSAGGAAYTGPAEDFSRPGQVWWSFPPDQARFPTWRLATTLYHEGVPGHHLQIGTAVHQAGRLNRFQRLMGKVAGYTEGWALYAERLSRELGFLAGPGQLLGMLDAQLFRAARVIVDIGMHLELRIPAGAGFHDGERWTARLGREFLATLTLIAPDRADGEIERYLGWPGQAPSYKLGERMWLQAAEAARASGGAGFKPAAFHSAALAAGPMGLDLLRDRFAAAPGPAPNRAARPEPGNGSRSGVSERPGG